MGLYENYKKTIDNLHKMAQECSSFKELAEKSGLGKKELQEQLKKMPLLYKQLELKFKDYVSYFEDEAIKFPEGKLIVLDASVIQAKNLMEAIELAIQAGHKFVLTSITIKELDLKKIRLRNSRNEQRRQAGINAQKLLGKAVYAESNIFPVDIPEVSLNPDDDIINAIKGNKENITLWSGDRAMLVKARMYDIKYMCVGEEINLPTNKKQEEKPVQKTETPQEEMPILAANVKAEMQKVQEQLTLAEDELEDILNEQLALSMERTNKETEIENMKDKLAVLQEKLSKCCLPIHKPNTSLFKAYMKNNKLYLSVKINPNTTMVEVHNALGEKKDLTAALEVGDTVLTVIMREDMTSINVREEQVTKIALTYNAHILFQKRVYSLEEEELACELPEKYFLAVKRFLHN